MNGNLLQYSGRTQIMNAKRGKKPKGTKWGEKKNEIMDSSSRKNIRKKEPGGIKN